MGEKAEPWQECAYTWCRKGRCSRAGGTCISILNALYTHEQWKVHLYRKYTWKHIGSCANTYRYTEQGQMWWSVSVSVPGKIQAVMGHANEASIRTSMPNLLPDSAIWLL